MTMHALIEDAKRVYVAAGLNCGDGLLPPATDVAFDEMAESLSLPIPPELRELYRVHGGQTYIEPGITGLFGMHRLHAPGEVIEHHRIFMDNCLLDPPPRFPPADDDWGYWVPELIPIASWDAYNLCIHAATGEVWEFIPNTGLIRHRPSIVAVLNEVIASVRAGGPAELGGTRLS